VPEAATSDDVLDQIASGAMTVAPPAQAHASLGTVIPYQPTDDFTATTGITPDQYDIFRGYLAKRESQSYGEPPHGTGSATTPTVSGRYQMGPGEITAASARLGIPNPTTDQFLADPELQERLFENYTLDHHNQLMHNPQYANGDANTRMALLAGAHLGGPGAISAWQRGQDRYDLLPSGKPGTHVSNYINGMYGALTGEAGGVQPGGVQLASATGPAPPGAPPTAASFGGADPLEAIASGQAYVGLPAGMTADKALPSMVTSDPETLGIPKGAAPLLDQQQLMRKAQGLALAGMNVQPIMSQIDQLQKGYQLYQMPDGTTDWKVQPGGLADPKRSEYNTLLAAHAQATGELVTVHINTPYGQQELQVPKDQYLDLQHKFPSLTLAGGAPFPQGATAPPPPTGTVPPAPGATVPPAPGIAPLGAPPAAPGAPPVAPPGPGVAGPGPGVPAPGPGVPAPGPGAPSAPPADPFAPIVDRSGNEGPAVISPPAPGPGLPQGYVGQRSLPPGGEGLVEAQIGSDQKSINDLQAQAKDAQRLQSTTQSVLGLLDGVTTGKLGPLAGTISGWLKGLGMSDEAAQNLTGTSAPNRDVLIKSLLQQAAAQMAGSGQGVGLFNEFLSALPSIETSKDAIKMFENTVNMQAQRTIDNRNQAQDYYNKSSRDYLSQKTIGYNPLTAFQTQFDKENPETNYYRAAQIMSSPNFAKEGHQTAADTGTTDQVLKLIPRGTTFIDANGVAMRRNAKGGIEPAPAPKPGSGPQAASPPGSAPGPPPAPGPAAAPPAPASGGPLAAPGLPGSSAPAGPPVPGLTPSTIQSLRDSGMTDADIARIQAAPSSVPSSGTTPSGSPYATAPIPPPPGVPQGSRVIGTRGGKPVYQTPDGRRLMVQ
jgi:hypothetical protein